MVLDELRPERVPPSPVQRAKASAASSSNPPGEEEGLVGGSAGCEEEVLSVVSGKTVAGDGTEDIDDKADSGREEMLGLEKEEEGNVSGGAVAGGVTSASSNIDCEDDASVGPVLSNGGAVPSAVSSTILSAGSSAVPSAVPDATSDPSASHVSGSTPGGVPQAVLTRSADAVAITEASGSSEHVAASPMASAVSKARVDSCPSGASRAGAVLEPPTTAIEVSCGHSNSCGDVGSPNPGATSTSSSSIVPSAVEIPRTDVPVTSSADAGNSNAEVSARPRDGTASRNEAIAADVAVTTAANNATTALAAESYFSLFSRPQQATTGDSASTSESGNVVRSETALRGEENLVGVEGARPNGVTEMEMDYDGERVDGD